MDKRGRSQIIQIGLELQHMDYTDRTRELQHMDYKDRTRVANHGKEREQTDSTDRSAVRKGS